MTEDEVEAITRAFAGPNYAEPEQKEVKRLDFDELHGRPSEEIFAAMMAFLRNMEGCSLCVELAPFSECRVSGYRLETPEETTARVKQTQEQAVALHNQQTEEMRRKYERLKAIFEGNVTP